MASLSDSLSFLFWIDTSKTCWRARITVVSMIIDRVDQYVNWMFRIKNWKRSLILAKMYSDSFLTEACKDVVDEGSRL